ncbi:MAG: hypothetical protein IGS50_13165 [Synechococcales cyanobacterium C42_A2020_086]|jgi:hypothetical protein|nr:hypothetical protein [Synechococcales cyanobacterium C42_A2020_086]
MNNLPSSSQLLGAGRSGQVFRINSESGEIARKVFYSDKLTSLVHYVFFGSPNPYIWNEDAIYCAFYRRKLLLDLVQVWFGNRLQVSDALAVAWNPEFKAYQLDTQFVRGRHVSLRQPCSQSRNQELATLVDEIMLPLQQLLMEAGLDGLVWQSGKGTPTALNNFLLTEPVTDPPMFCWIDLESGVPALFPINILQLFQFYLPKSFHYRRPLFDDVDGPKLKRYLHRHQQQLQACWGQSRYAKNLERVEQLEYHQARWKSMRRVDRSIHYQLKKGRIDPQQARWYSQRPLLWYGREGLRAIDLLLNALVIKLPRRLLCYLQALAHSTFLRHFWQFLISHGYRVSLARDYIIGRIETWHQRHHLTEEEFNNLMAEFHQERSSEYINGFGVHIGLKIFFQAMEIGVLPLLYFAGLISAVGVVTWVVVGGPVYRTIYTFYRLVRAATKGKPLPWIALFVGLLPTVGLLAYPCQIIYSAHEERKQIAQFVVYDFFTRIGAKIPIWGGEDTQTEHVFNHIADYVVRSEQRG